MKKSKLYDIDLNNEENKKEMYNILYECNSKSDFFKRFEMSDNSHSYKEIDRIAKIVGFDFNIWKERKTRLRYCQNPECNKILLYGQEKYCSRSCAATVNNKKYPKRSCRTEEILGRTIKLKHYQDICPKCGNPKCSESKLCKDCEDDRRRNEIGERTLFYYTRGEKYLTSRCTEIRKHARTVIERSDKEKVCAYCHDHTYDEILETHHLKSILSFSSDSKIKEINDIDNLVWLCPNHHAMLEKGLISEDDLI